MEQAAERMESLKAGVVGVIVAAIAVAMEIAAAFTVRLLIHVPTLESVDLKPQMLIAAAIATLSGGLFGITYRYLCIEDNLQLQLGAVGAFGLVRGLAQIETTWPSEPYWLTALKLLASLLMFAITALVLNWAIRQGWIRRFSKP